MELLASQKTRIINLYFQRDIEYFLNIRNIRDLLTYITGKTLFNLIIRDYEKEEFKKVKKNLDYVHDKYFVWDEIQYPDPMDQYLFIKNNWELLIYKLFEGVNHDYYNIFNFYRKVSHAFEVMADNLYKAAVIHKFDLTAVETLGE